MNNNGLNCCPNRRFVNQFLVAILFSSLLLMTQQIVFVVAISDGALKLNAKCKVTKISQNYWQFILNFSAGLIRLHRSKSLCPVGCAANFLWECHNQPWIVQWTWLPHWLWLHFHVGLHGRMQSMPTLYDQQTTGKKICIFFYHLESPKFHINFS